MKSIVFTVLCCLLLWCFSGDIISGGGDRIVIGEGEIVVTLCEGDSLSIHDQQRFFMSRITVNHREVEGKQVVESKKIGVDVTRIIIYREIKDKEEGKLFL